ncbi:lanthionine synthetase LanC family protein [Rhizobium ruizarguesonis]|uniref:lanthionine synthetase LanC family protein n=1 Tax=Rhizobium ruizarguesonis TaxID=2081791 RepID=UPI0013EE58AB|nr:lanthionine synthetase LanC family protein [Rhizobium ruizarguesonis]
MTSSNAIEAAWNIGVKLANDAVWDAERCNWIGASCELFNGRLTNVTRSLGPDVYSGTSGIALYLAFLYHSTGEALFKRTALGALNHALSRPDDFQPELDLGLYSGRPGVAFAAIIIGRLIGDESLFDAGLSRLLSYDLNNIAGKRGLDITTGIAGLIPIFIYIHQLGNTEALDIAIDLAGTLGKTARRSERGLSWDTTNAAQTGVPDLVGFAHGAGGIGWSLLELFNATQRDEYRSMAFEAFDYEESWFDFERGNWPDFRGFNPADDGGRPGFTCAWCHGAPGIGFSRLRAFQITKEQRFLDQSLAALKTTVHGINRDIGGNFSLCHGLSGNSDLLIFAADVLKNKEYSDIASRVGEIGIELYLKADKPWPCGVSGFSSTPNLMLGLAGIGWFYLRLHEEQVPSVLLMSPTSLPF